MRTVTNLVVANIGEVRSSSDVTGVVLVDENGAEVLPVSQYLQSLLAGGASTASARSYAIALLRWWRFLAAVDVTWDHASQAHVRDFVLWMRFTTKPAKTNVDKPGAAALGRPASTSGTGYAPTTINHNLAVLRGFYDDRIAAGCGLARNPVPEAMGRGGDRPHAHHNPMRMPEVHRRAALRQTVPVRLPRGLPDRLFDALFAAMTSDRDRALLAFYVSTGARASELLGVTTDRVDVGRQVIGVHRKGSGRLQWLPASADAFVWLRLYQQSQARPAGESSLWLTRRAPHRPLTYSAMRRVLQRANDQLSTRWTLHDLRHTAAHRMVRDPHLSLTDVQWVLGHAHLTTTQIYLQPREEEVIARVHDYHQHQARRQAAAAPPPAGGYRPEVLETLFGAGRHGR